MNIQQILVVSRIFLFVSGYLAYPDLASLSSGNNFTYRSESKHHHGANGAIAGDRTLLTERAFTVFVTWRFCHRMNILKNSTFLDLPGQVLPF